MSSETLADQLRAWGEKQQRAANGKQLRAKDTDAGEKAERVHIRLGGAPIGGRSRIKTAHSAKSHEAGVSVYRARRVRRPDSGVPDQAAYYLVDIRDDIQAYNLAGFLHAGRPLYEVAGVELPERGSDGEPLLTEVEIARSFNYPESVTIEPTRFKSHVEYVARHRGGWERVLLGSRGAAGQRLAEPGDPGHRVFLKTGGAPYEFPRLNRSRQAERHVERRSGHLLPAVVEEVRRRSTSTGRHSEEHWKRVAAASLTLCEYIPQADPVLCFYFALFHDCMCPPGGRASHAAGGAELAGELLEGELPARDLEILVRACRAHMQRRTTSDPTIAACFDGDRLNIWRVGMKPEPALLSTAEACTPEMIEWARFIQTQDFSWAELWREAHSPTRGVQL